jgi:hypothetical protein
MIAWRFWERKFWNTVMGWFLVSMLFWIIGLVLLQIAGNV